MDLGWMLCGKHSDPNTGKIRFNSDGAGASLGGKGVLGPPHAGLGRRN